MIGYDGGGARRENDKNETRGGGVEEKIKTKVVAGRGREQRKVFQTTKIAQLHVIVSCRVLLPLSFSFFRCWSRGEKITSTTTVVEALFRTCFYICVAAK